MSFLKTNLKRTVHVIPVTFRAGDQTGAINETIVVATSQKNEAPLRVAATGYVVDAANADGNAPGANAEENAPLDALLSADSADSADLDAASDELADDAPSLTPAKNAPKVAALLSTDDAEDAEPIRLQLDANGGESLRIESDAKNAAPPKAPRRGVNLFQEFPRRAPPIKKRVGAVERPGLDARLDGVASANAFLDVERPVRATPTSADVAVDSPNAVISAVLAAPASPALAPARAVAFEPFEPFAESEPLAQPLRRRPIPRELLPATIPGS